MTRNTTKGFIEDIRYELIESVGETYNDKYLIKWLNEGNKKFFAGVPIGGALEIEPMYFDWAKKKVDKVLVANTDTVPLDFTVRRILKVEVDGVDIVPKEYEDINGESFTDPVFALTADGLYFPAGVTAGQTVAVVADVWDKTLDWTNDDDTFEIIRPVYEDILMNYVWYRAKNRNEYAATLAEEYKTAFNEAMLLARKESLNIVADEPKTVKIVTQLFA